jgi:hypothetical protein
MSFDRRYHPEEITLLARLSTRPCGVQVGGPRHQLELEVSHD